MEAAAANSPRARDAIRLARRRILAGRPVRMQEVAAELDVSRVSIHRWVGSREQLLAEALWSLAEGNLNAAEKATHLTGGAKIADMMARFIRTVRAEPGMRSFMEREPELALRILTTNATPVQARSIAAVEDLLAEEVAAGRVEPPMSVPDLAYVIVRITESFLYADLLTGAPPDHEKARQAVAALLR